MTTIDTIEAVKDATATELAAVLAAVAARLVELGGTGESVTTAARGASSSAKAAPMSGEEFRHRRSAAGLTQEQAARVLDVTHRTVMRWEHGESRIRSPQAEFVRRQFGPFRARP